MKGTKVYAVKEIYYTLQGEGANTGRPAVFLRFAGCNLWSGREEDRESAVCSFCDTDFVGTDGPGGGKFAGPETLAAAVSDEWQSVRLTTDDRRPAQSSGPDNAAQKHALPDTPASRGRELKTPLPWREGVGGGGTAPQATLVSRQSSIVNRFVVCTGGEPLLQLDEPLIRALHDKEFTVAVETNGTIPAPPGIDWLCVSPKAGAPLAQKTGSELKLVYPQTGASPEEYEHLAFDHFFLQPMDGPDLERNTRLTVEYCLKNPRWRLSLQTHKFLGIP